MFHVVINWCVFSCLSTPESILSHYRRLATFFIIIMLSAYFPFAHLWNLLSSLLYLSWGIQLWQTMFTDSLSGRCTIGIKHGFSCINAEAAVFNTSQGTWRMLMHWKTMFDRYYCIKTENICYISFISCTTLFRLFTDVSRTHFPRTMLVLGPGSTHLVTAANLWSRYDHMESCVAVH